MVEQQAASITTSVDSDLEAAIAQAKVLQEAITKLTATKAEETATQERERIDVIIGDFSSEVLSTLKSTEWADSLESLIKLGCNGFSINWQVDSEGDGYMLSFSPTKVVTEKAKSMTSGGTQRDLEGMFQAVATPEQKAHLGTLENNSKQYQFKNRVVTADDPKSVPVPTA